MPQSKHTSQESVLRMFVDPQVGHIEPVVCGLSCVGEAGSSALTRKLFSQCGHVTLYTGFVIVCAYLVGNIFLRLSNSGGKALANKCKPSTKSPRWIASCASSKV